MIGYAGDAEVRLSVRCALFVVLAEPLADLLKADAYADMFPPRIKNLTDHLTVERRMYQDMSTANNCGHDLSKLPLAKFGRDALRRGAARPGRRHGLRAVATLTAYVDRPRRSWSTSTPSTRVPRTSRPGRLVRTTPLRRPPSGDPAVDRQLHERRGTGTRPPRPTWFDLGSAGRRSTKIRPTTLIWRNQNVTPGGAPSTKWRRHNAAWEVLAGADVSR